MTLEISPLVTGYILGVFRYTLTANDKYPVRNCDNLSSPFQMQLSFKPKAFSDSFIPFLESTSHFKHFEKKVDCLSYFITEITNSERVGYTTL